MGEPGQWKKKGHCDVVKTGETHFFHLGFLWLGAVGEDRSSTCAASDKDRL